MRLTAMTLCSTTGRAVHQPVEPAGQGVPWQSPGPRIVLRTSVQEVVRVDTPAWLSNIDVMPDNGVSFEGTSSVPG